ncbi:MAG: universal stress protein [Chlorobium sp.]|jgi:nucleotide-binding universal stress UspA family protein|uniref:universal stress protein n=1 Tax=Chlorobium sp. TaxID=1095 RepID=UPI001D60092F|nr:universal stress protein [Chlorobium sp.]MBN1278681.1 universal stress protein [Chlorobiaceae bacterium]MCF8216674.1 universal stress protein [Chlorobium sp.]MCF8270865.1 universal stress protein [Chlorobium sp.]MCF8287201.1 universal stress protein [Chlorobium sp.]MCF8290858.1 universal stress protein [Chlorobium sp.]
MNILAAVDFSHVTEEVVSKTKTLAAALQAKVFLLHVIAPATPVIDMETNIETWTPVMDPPEIMEEDRRERPTYNQLLEIASGLRAAGLDVSVAVAHNDEVSAIIEAAETADASLIILGSHGHGALYNLLVGSVSEGVVRKATCPVVIVPAQKR